MFIDMEITFIVVAGGCGIGILIFLVEHLLKWIRRLINWILKLKHLEMTMKRRSRKLAKMKTFP